MAVRLCFFFARQITRNVQDKISSVFTGLPRQEGENLLLLIVGKVQLCCLKKQQTVQALNCTNLHIYAKNQRNNSFYNSWL